MFEHFFLQIITDTAKAPFFKEYSEYIIGVPSLIITLWFGYWVYKKQVNRKELSYQIKNQIPLFYIDNNYKKRFKIQFDGADISNLSLLSIEFTNTGNQPILKEDFESDIKIMLTNNTNSIINVLSYEITQKEPQSISTTISFIDNKLCLSPCLLNPKDSFTINVLVDYAEIDSLSFNIDSRIAGVKGLQQVIAYKKKSWEILTPAYLVIATAVSALLIGTLTLIGPEETFRYITNNVILKVFGIGGIIYILIFWYQLSRKLSENK